jgi:phosphate transport system substrate-binding protein
LVVFLSGCTQQDVIVVVGRDEASGTRGSFDELVLDKKDPTEKMVQLNSNTLIHDRVATTKLAIGYVGLGYLDEKVKALKIDGITPSKSTVLDLSYPIARDLNMFTNGTPTGDVKWFIDFILSDDGQDIVSSIGFVPIPSTGVWDWSVAPSIDIDISGSTTVLPIATAAAAAYEGNVTDSSISIAGGGSSTGVAAIGDGSVNIGMSSRELKEEEATNFPFLEKNVVGKDGIAIVVHPSNEVTGMKLETVKLVYLGNITTWAKVKEESGTTTESAIASAGWLIAIFEKIGKKY